MKRRLSLVFALACAFCLAFGLVGCGQSDEYKPKSLKPTVSTPVIGQDGTLRVGVNANGGAPFVIVPDDGSMTGLDVDIAAALSNQLGLKVELVDVGADPATAIQNGDVDVVMGLTSADESETVAVTNPYLTTGVALFSGAQGVDVPTVESAPQIAAQSSSTSAWAVENAFGDSCVVPSADLMSAFSSVETGEAAYVAADAVIGTYAALYQNVDVQPIALLGATSGYCIGVSALNADLQAAVADALTAIADNGVLGVVCSKWLGATLDLESLPAIDVSTSESAVDESSEEGEDEEASLEESDEASSEDSSSEASDGSSAGANAVLPA